MGRLRRLSRALLLAAGLLLLVAPMPAAGFDGFGAISADATYGVSLEFSVELLGAAPDELELVLDFPASEATFVVTVIPTGATATYVWDVGANYVTPNTPVGYRWRATSEGEVVLSERSELLYTDDRAELSWQSETVGDATVHWHGDAEAAARLFGETTDDAVNRAESLLGTQLAGPVDIFVYAARNDFFEAVGPGIREWAGAAAASDVRTIFIWLEAGSRAYLESVVIHEVTHIVFFDATHNPYHEPALWLNEGIATWSEAQSDDGERETVQSEAAGAGLIAFEGISEVFPIDNRGAHLAYAEGTTMVDRIIDQYGADAIARIAAAYRDGASDAEALEAGTGVPADQLYADFYAAYGVPAPQPVEPEPILPSDVELPAGARGVPRPTPAVQTAPAEGPASDDRGDLLVLIPMGAGLAVAGGAAVIVARRAARSGTRSA